MIQKIRHDHKQNRKSCWDAHDRLIREILQQGLKLAWCKCLVLSTSNDMQQLQSSLHLQSAKQSPVVDPTLPQILTLQWCNSYLISQSSYLLNSWLVPIAKSILYRRSNFAKISVVQRCGVYNILWPISLINALLFWMQNAYSQLI